MYFKYLFVFFCSAGMSAFFTVENCPESNALPEKLNVQHTYEEEERDEDYPMDNLFSIVLRPGGPPSVLRSGGRRPKVWIHYISAEEVMWDYNPEGDRYDHWKFYSGKTWMSIIWIV